jgi:hypothetical protein
MRHSYAFWYTCAAELGRCSIVIRYGSGTSKSVESVTMATTQEARLAHSIC